MRGKLEAAANPLPEAHPADEKRPADQFDGAWLILESRSRSVLLEPEQLSIPPTAFEAWELAPTWASLRKRSGTLGGALPLRAARPTALSLVGGDASAVRSRGAVGDSRFQPARARGNDRAPHRRR